MSTLIQKTLIRNRLRRYAMIDQILEKTTSRRLCIAIPASVVSDVPHLREKTSKIGLIGRAAAIFRVDEIIIFPDIPNFNQKAEINMISTLLKYIETPQYLRKRLFKLDPNLQYAGILPPLRTPHHPLNSRMKTLRIGEFREAVTLQGKEKQTLLDIGVEKPAILHGKCLAENMRVTVKIVKVGKVVEVELANREAAPAYWGYTVTVETCPLSRFIKNRHFDLVIGTSKYGSPFLGSIEQLAERWKTSNRVLVAFGAPTQGLNEIAEREGRRLNELADFIVNMVPMQGTETVRTEEALVASLAVFNVFLT